MFKHELLYGYCFYLQVWRRTCNCYFINNDFWRNLIMYWLESALCSFAGGALAVLILHIIGII